MTTNPRCDNVAATRRMYVFGPVPSAPIAIAGNGPSPTGRAEHGRRVPAPSRVGRSITLELDVVVRVGLRFGSPWSRTLARPREVVDRRRCGTDGAQRRQLDQHTAAELEFDVDATMATVDDDCRVRMATRRGSASVVARRVARMYAAFLPRWKQLTDTTSSGSRSGPSSGASVGRIREQVAFVRDESGASPGTTSWWWCCSASTVCSGERTYASPSSTGCSSASLRRSTDCEATTGDDRAHRLAAHLTSGGSGHAALRRPGGRPRLCETAPDVRTSWPPSLVFVCSAAVLMLEILAGRLLAPYVGISLETYTSIIGTVLAGIAVGAWVGGKLADRIDPRRLLGPTVALGGLLVAVHRPGRALVRRPVEPRAAAAPRVFLTVRRLLPPGRRARARSRRWS